MPAKINKDITLGVVKSGSTVTTLKGLTSLTPPQESVAQVDVTTFDSISAESAPGLADPGTVSAEFFFDPDDADHLWLREHQGELLEWQIVIPGAATGTSLTIEYDGYITSYEPNLNARGEAATFSLEIKVSGRPTYDYDDGVS